ncbi:PREDICTED: protein FAM177A1-like [Vollenhovia emeryi]|uniref:protein FAM177A1-like n=1 Tax=Vollenhovia emeryi TaxID=411798 RepID=UPI0005F41451|nr:PREDICTED: protein FAM177A1-like [Vollenhovia emeryi]
MLCRFSRHRSLRMSHRDGERRTRGGSNLLDALSRIVRARRRAKGFVYRKIRPTMAERDDAGDLSDVILQEKSDAETQCKHKLGKKPKRVLQFSDGVMEEYSSEDEVDAPKINKVVPQIDTKNMNWLPWAWYQTTWLSCKMLEGCDYVGECLADFFGITAPKYRFEINEFYRLQALEKERFLKQDLEMGGWNEHKRNNLISSDVLTDGCK